jgi:hypothetical protein
MTLFEIFVVFLIFGAGVLAGHAAALTGTDGGGLGYDPTGIAPDASSAPEASFSGWVFTVGTGPRAVEYKFSGVTTEADALKKFLNAGGNPAKITDSKRM